MKFRRAICLRMSAPLTLAACGFAGIAGAADTANAPYMRLKTLLPPGEDATLCLGRRYDAEHLREHPKQTVTEVLLSIRYRPLKGEDAVLEARDDGGIEKRRFIYDFTLAAKVRGKKETLYASGDCSSAEGIGCGVDCDGGGIDIEPVEFGGAVLVRLERIRMTQGCIEGPRQVDLVGGADDKVFELGKMPESVCKEMRAEAEKEAE